MIQELREYSQSFLFKLLLGVICVTFVVSFGVGSFGDRKEVIAKVNGREILLKDYRKAYQNRLQSLRQQFGENADAFAEQINLRQRVFEQMIDQELLAIEAENMNLEATDLELQEEIRNQPYFQKDGNFDFETYNTVLSQNRIVRQEYEDSLREELKVRKLQKLIGVGLLVSSKEVDEMYQLENQKIQIGYLHFDPQVFIPGVEIKDGEVRQYFEENRDAFKTEKAYRIESFVLGLQDFQEEVKVKEREIRRYYEKTSKPTLLRPKSRPGIFYSKSIRMPKRNNSSNDVRNSSSCSMKSGREEILKLWQKPNLKMPRQKKEEISDGFSRVKWFRLLRMRHFAWPSAKFQTSFSLHSGCT